MLESLCVALEVVLDTLCVVLESDEELDEKRLVKVKVLFDMLKEKLDLLKHSRRRSASDVSYQRKSKNLRR